MKRYKNLYEKKNLKEDIFQTYENLSDRIFSLIKDNLEKNEVVGFAPYLASAMVHAGLQKKDFRDFVELFEEGLY